MEDLRPRVLEFMRRNGPSLPVQIAKYIERDIFLSGAILSELIKGKKVHFSSAKVGGSPIYYLPGQEYRLSILYPHLKERERKAYDLLRSKKVLKDNELEPWQRVALRNLKDFAFMLKVKNNGTEEIFWKWYLVSDNEAESLIKEFIVKREPVIEKKEPIIEKKEPVKVAPKKRIRVERPRLNVLGYFQNNNLEVLEEKVVRKNKEVDYIVNVGSDIGKIKFFVKVRDKVKISDNDLMLAQSQARFKGLTLLFISNGELTKRGKEFLEKNQILFKKI